MRLFLTLFLIFIFFATTKGQEQLLHEPSLYVDSTGQVFTQSKQPAYFFVSPEAKPNELMAIPSSDPNATPMYWDGEGVHYISHKEAKTNKTILFRIVADDTPPITDLAFSEGVIFVMRNNFYVELGATAISKSRDGMTAVRETFYSIDGSPYQSLEKGFKFSTEGVFAVKLYSIDMVGNVEDPKVFKVITSADAVIQMDNIYFDLNSSNLRKESVREINTLIDLLNEYPNINIELRAHTDTRGESRYNMELSRARANSVVSYMVSKGISHERLIAKGYGDTIPLNECKKGVRCSEEMHRQNRRVEFLIIKVKD
jgi:outer membrane protein OmpA-like peptidoglycan-associated protein